jgi:hypothetical protein
MSRLLGWGEITYHRYENGSLPDQSHNNQLRLIKEPSNVKILLENNSDNLSSKTIKKLNKRLEEMIANKNKVEVTLPEELYKQIKMKAEKDKMNFINAAQYPKINLINIDFNYLGLEDEEIGQKNIDFKITDEVIVKDYDENFVYLTFIRKVFFTPEMFYNILVELNVIYELNEDFADDLNIITPPFFQKDE